MESFRKTVIICCLIYFIYGLVSLFDNGVYVPPFPLKPLLFIVLLIAYAIKVRPKTKIDFLALLWLLFLIFEGNYLVELLFSTNIMELYNDYITPFVVLISALLLTVITFLVAKAKYRKPFPLLFLFGSMNAVALLLYTSSRITFYWMILGTSLLFFIVDRLVRSTNNGESTTCVQLTISAVAIINFLEMIPHWI